MPRLMLMMPLLYTSPGHQHPWYCLKLFSWVLMAWRCKKGFNSKELFILHMFSWSTGTCLSFIVNIMGADGLVMQAAMAWWNQNIPAHLLLMLWLLASPGHRPPWYWLCRTRVLVIEHFSWGTRTCLSCIVNILCADSLGTQGATAYWKLNFLGYLCLCHCCWWCIGLGVLEYSGFWAFCHLLLFHKYHFLEEV